MSSSGPLLFFFSFCHGTCPDVHVPQVSVSVIFFTFREHRKELGEECVFFLPVKHHNRHFLSFIFKEEEEDWEG